MINHIHIQSLFWLSENEELSIPDMLKVGSQVQTAWESILASNFPNKQFKVIFNDHVTSDGWVGDMHVTAYQIAKNA